jgi:hemoglobin
VTPEFARKLATALYKHVERDPVIRPIFPRHFKCAIDAFSSFLVQFTGGPQEHAQGRWFASLRESHARFRIGARERKHWLACMAKALDDVQAPPEWRELFEHSSAYLVNDGETPAAPAIGNRQMRERWEEQLRVEAAVGDVRRGRAPESKHPGVLALRVRAGQVLGRDPALIHVRHFGRTLLHEAAESGNLAMVEMLLDLGADPNVKTTLGHTPLYNVANGAAMPRSAEIVHVLVRAGAIVDACDGVQRTTPLHMAARRGNVDVADTLLDCGASINARDRKGETPLKRAVKCRKMEVAARLRQRGAT